MRNGSVRQAFRLAGAPVTFLTVLCVALGLAALSFDAGAALAFMLAGLGAMLTFIVAAEAVVPARPPTSDIPPHDTSVDRRRRHR